MHRMIIQYISEYIAKAENFTSEVKQRQRIPVELSLFMMRSVIFVKMLKQQNARLLSNEGSSHLSEVNLNNFVSLLTRRVISRKLAPVFGVEQVRAV